MAYTLTEDGLGRQARPLVGNESEDGTGVWHVLVCDTSGRLKVALSNIADDVAITFGGVAKLLWETADANANALVLALPVGTSVDVPVLVIGDANIINVDLAFFNGITLPTLAVMNVARDAYIKIDSGDINASGKGVYFKAAADEVIEIINLSVTGTPRIYWWEAGDMFQSTKGWRFESETRFDAGVDIQGGNIKGGNSDNSALPMQARDNGVGLVNVARMVGAADPYFEAGRDDTGVSTSAITDGLVLQMGAGSNNEAAGQGFGISVKIGNAASELEERGSIDLRLVTATDGAENSGWDFSTMLAGAMNLAFKVDQAGEIYGDADSTSGTYMTQNANLFDEFDDVEELRRFQLTVPRTGLISEEQRLANRQRMVALGVFEENPLAHSGYMMRIQQMTRLLAGGIYQTRQALEMNREELLGRLNEVEARLASIGV